MAIVTATACGKIILFGEHAVVYGRPAIAAPLTLLRAQAVVQASTVAGVCLLAPDLGVHTTLDAADADDPLAAVLRHFAQAAKLAQWPDLTVTVHSDIPVASGLGSGAAITTAMLRALAAYFALPHLANPPQLSALTYEVEKLYHGTPSGIDNTVIAYEQPVYFMRQQPQNQIEPFRPAVPIDLLVADTGIRSSTKVVVEDVRRRWQADPIRFEQIFTACGDIVAAARQAIEQGNLAELGQLMTYNHEWLQEMSVSGPELDVLVQAALEAGALGAKLSGAGRGGNMIALVTRETAVAVQMALQQAGAHRVLLTRIEP